MAKQIAIILVAFILCASANVNAQTELIYNAGVYQNNIKLKPKEVRELMRDDSIALSKYKSGRVIYITGKCIFYPFLIPVGVGGFFIIAGIGGAGSGTLLGNELYYAIGASSMVIGGLGMFIGYMVYDSGERKMKQAVKLYNTNINSNKVSVNFGLTGNGVGVNVRF